MIVKNYIKQDKENTLKEYLLFIEKTKNGEFAEISEISVQPRLEEQEESFCGDDDFYYCVS